MNDIYTRVSVLALEHIEDKATRDNFLAKFAILLNDYTVQPASNELVVYDDQDLKIMNVFLGTKAVEGLSKRSIKYYGTILAQVKKDTCKPITELTTNEIRAYLARGLMERKWSINTANNVRAVLLSFFGWAYKEKAIADNPMTRVQRIKGIKKVRLPLSSEEIEKLRNAANVRNRAIIEVLLSTGCRVSELTGLTRNAVDFREGKAKVLGKGNKERWVYFNSLAKMYLAKYLDSRNDDVPALFVEESTPHRPLSFNAVEAMLRKLGKCVGVEKVHPHRFRHTAATTALRRGMPIDMIQKVLGHENISTTMIYAHTDGTSVQENHRKYLN